MMRYMEYPPCPALAGHVACFWTASVQPPPAAAAARTQGRAPPAAAPVNAQAAVSHRVLPDNCIDILWQDSGAAFAVGMMSRFIDVPASGPLRTVAVRFLPGAAPPFLRERGAGRQDRHGVSGAPLASLADTRADLDLLWARSDADRLGDALWSHDLDDLARVALVEAAMLGRLAGVFPAARSAAALVRHAVAAIESTGGGLQIEQLASSFGVSRQHLSAQFREQVGLSPKLFARVTRFRRAMSAASQAATARATGTAGAAGMARDREPDWAGLALSCGYFDQSHLIHDFHDFAGASPDAWLSTR